MSRAIGILAHVDAGKTTLSEQILYHTNSIRTRGRVDHQDTFLDSHPIEKERGITVFSGQAQFTYEHDLFYLLDTPGHADFSAEMERALSVIDCAVVVVSCVEGVQGHTETIWELLKAYEMPVLFFLNKTDRAGASPERVMEELKARCSADCVCLSGHFALDCFDDELAQALAERDDCLLEHYLEFGCDQELWLSRAKSLTAQRKLFPCFSGSALNDEGISELLAAFPRLITQKTGSDEGFSAKVYQIRHDKQGTRLAFLRVLSGALHTKDEICVGVEGSRPVYEKVNELRGYSGEKYVPLQQVESGGLCAVTGLSTVRPGDRVGARCERQPFAMQPLLKARVLYDEKAVSLPEVLHVFRLLEDEEPELSVTWEEELRELHVHVMGNIQLEILSELLQERFDLQIAFGPCRIVYRETIAAGVTGYGHFEPLRHYAEVHLRLEPARQGSGISFASACSTDVLEANFQNLIQTHVFEKEHIGLLTGSPLTDVKITLLTGRAHVKHTEGGDFREATRRAVRQGLEQAEMVLLEPWYAFSLSIPAEALGRVLSDIQRLHGIFEPPEAQQNRVLLHGRGPVSEFLSYPAELTAVTRGASSASFRFDGYQPCHNTAQVVAERGYDKDRDTANPSYSVFCSHGAGFPVKWQEVKQYIHCES